MPSIPEKRTVSKYTAERGEKTNMSLGLRKYIGYMYIEI